VSLTAQTDPPAASRPPSGLTGGGGPTDPPPPPAPTEPSDDIDAAEAAEFEALDRMWESLRKGSRDGTGDRANAGGGLDADGRVLAALLDAGRMLDEDSRPPAEVAALVAAEGAVEPVAGPASPAAGADQKPGSGRGAEAAPSPPPLPIPPPTPALQPGMRIGQYRIEGRLATGGMGEVWLAEHEFMGRRVALKVIAPHLSQTAPVVRRFLHEVRMLAELKHPNIVSALDAGRDGGRLFLVMEFVPGVDLATHVKRTGPLSPLTAAGMVRQVAQGLDHAHRHGVIHRDIKPGNLMLSPDGTVTILDLGLGKSLTEELSRSGFSSPSAPAGAERDPTGLTAPGVALGTPNFMAPEQGLDATAADAGSDLFSLGATFYYLLTAESPLAGSSRGLRGSSVARDGPVPPIRPVRETRPEVPEPLAAVVDRLLAARPEDRFASARELLSALEAVAPAAPPEAALDRLLPAPPKELLPAVIEHLSRQLWAPLSAALQRQIPWLRLQSNPVPGVAGPAGELGPDGAPALPAPPVSVSASLRLRYWLLVLIPTGLALLAGGLGLGVLLAGWVRGG
jgi:serine/threonine protein kinase